MYMPVILLVDDTKLFLEVGRTFLKNSRVTVLTAANGLEALHTIRAERPDLIYMDLHMPEMDGAACCATLKADPALRSIPVIMQIADGKPKDREICREAGCDGIITKPIDRKLFLEMGHTFLSTIDRREERIPCRTTVVFMTHAGTFYGTSVDICLHGIFVASTCDVKDEETMDINFVVPGKSSGLVEAWGRVAWVNKGISRIKPHLPEGFGVEFLEMTDESSSIIRTYMDEEGKGT